MVYCAVGKTKSGKEIVIHSIGWHDGKIPGDIVDLSDIDKLDFLLVVQFLSLRETRRKIFNQGWFGLLSLYEIFLAESLGDRITDLKAQIGISSAFAARDYARSLVYKQFKDFY